MKSLRFKKTPYVFAALYLAWSLFAYFGSLGSEAHSWWPVFLYIPIWPWSWLEHSAIQPLLSLWLTPGPEPGPESAYILMDRFSGAYYIIVGTVWYWWIGRWIFLGLTKLMCPKEERGRSRPPENNARDVT